MANITHPHHPFRILFLSGLISLVILTFVGFSLGGAALFLTLVLVLLEITFSFDNAIINARVLTGMSKFWQDMFMTVGILIAVFGMRLVFPIVLVMLTTGLGAVKVVDLALNQPAEYAAAIHSAHPSIAAFGGMFLLMLCLAFLVDPRREVVWLKAIEHPMRKLSQWWQFTLAALVVLLAVALLPANHHPRETLVAGVIGIVTYLALILMTSFFQGGKLAHPSKKHTAWAGFASFLYLQVLDASFSFDGVIGAFAVTQDVIIIAIGLGVGALWVRSLTLLLVKRKTLEAYRYLEHGAHYTIGVLAAILLLGLFFNVPDVVAGSVGLVIVGLSILSSVQERKVEKKRALIP